MKKRILVIAIALLISSCSTVATITNHQGRVSTYRGPKDVDMSVKRGDVEIKYSGKSEGWFSRMMQYLLVTTPTIAIAK